MADNQMDGRRRRWYAMPAEWPFDPLGSRLLEEFGNPGVAVWSCFVAAAKRSPIEGTINFTTEAEAWSQLGLQPPEFTLEEFLRVTGAMKETRRRRRGRVTDVTLTRWEELQQTLNRQLEREQKARSREGITPDKDRTDRDSDSDSDRDSSSREFEEFNLDRARADAKRQQDAGTRVRTLVGLANTIAEREDFRSESQHRFNHRGCNECRDGYNEVYTAGSGNVKIACTAEPLPEIHAVDELVK